jgi:hypothetical protein
MAWLQASVATRGIPPWRRCNGVCLRPHIQLIKPRCMWGLLFHRAAVTLLKPFNGEGAGASDNSDSLPSARSG